MGRRVSLEIVTPHQIASLQHAPTGFTYVDQMFREAGWQDEASRLIDAEEAAWLREIFRHFRRWPYKGRVQIRLVSLWSLLGLWRSVRFRLRSYPACVVQAREVYTGRSLDELDALVKAALIAPNGQP